MRITFVPVFSFTALPIRHVGSATRQVLFDAANETNEKLHRCFAHSRIRRCLLGSGSSRVWRESYAKTPEGVYRSKAKITTKSHRIISAARIHHGAKGAMLKVDGGGRVSLSTSGPRKPKKLSARQPSPRYLNHSPCWVDAGNCAAIRANHCLCESVGSNSNSSER